MIFIYFLTLVICVYSQTNGTCGTNCQWNYDSQTKTMTITGEGDINDIYEEKDRDWTGIINEVEKVIISEGILRIGRYAFTRYSSSARRDKREEDFFEI